MTKGKSFPLTPEHIRYILDYDPESGVLTKSSSRFYARIQINNKGRHLGGFDTPEGAHEAYCKTATLIFGEFSRTS